MRTDIDGASLPWANAEFPGDDAAQILSQVLVADDTVVFQREIFEADASKHLILWRPGPGIDDGHFASHGLADNQVVHRDLAKVESVHRRIKTGDISIGWIHGKDLGAPIIRLWGWFWGRLRSGCRQWLGCRGWLDRDRPVVHP